MTQMETPSREQTNRRVWTASPQALRDHTRNALFVQGCHLFLIVFLAMALLALLPFSPRPIPVSLTPTGFVASPGFLIMLIAVYGQPVVWLVLAWARPRRAVVSVAVDSDQLILGHKSGHVTALTWPEIRAIRAGTVRHGKMQWITVTSRRFPIPVSVILRPPLLPMEEIWRHLPAVAPPGILQDAKPVLSRTVATLLLLTLLVALVLLGAFVGVVQAS